MEGYYPPELPPEQPDEPDSPLDMEIAPREPQTDELDNPEVQAWLAMVREHGVPVASEGSHRLFVPRPQDMEVAPAAPTDSEARDGVAERLAAWQAQAPEALFAQGVDFARLIWMRQGRGLEEWLKKDREAWEGLYGHDLPSEVQMVLEEQEAYWKEVHRRAGRAMGLTEEPYSDNPDVG